MFRFRIFLGTLAVMLAALSSAQADTQYFQYNASRTTWDNGTTADWALSSGGAYDQVWTSGNDAVFELTAGMVSIAAAGATAHNLTFNITGYTIQNNTLTLNGSAPTISLSPGCSATISSTVDGSAGLTKSGAGTLTLSSANTYTGGTTNSAGKLIAGNVSAFGTSGAITLGDANSGANAIALSIGGNAISRPITVANYGGTVTLAGNAVYSGAITLSRDVSLGDGTGTPGFTGGISGTGNVTISSSGGWAVNFGVVSGGGTANTFSGNLSIPSGANLNIGSGWASSNKAIPDTATVNVAGALNVAIGGNNETIDALTGGGSVSLSAASDRLTVGSANGSGTFSGIISGSGGITKIGIGTQTVSGVNTYSGGTTLTNGTLALAGSGRLGATTGAVTVNGSAAVLELGGLTRTNGAVVLGDGIITNGTLQGSSFSVTNGAVYAIFTGNASLTKAGAGTVTMTNNNTYTVATIVSNGTLKLSGSGTLGTNTSAVTVNGGAAVLDLGGLLCTNAAVVLGDGVITNGTLQGTSFSVTNGSIYAILTGSAGLTKGGAGTVTLATNNTYTAGTTITNGMLKLGSGSNRLPTATALALGGPSGTPTLDLNGNAQQVASLSDSGGYVNGVITNSGAAVTLTLSPASGTTTFSGAIKNGGGTINLVLNGSGTQTLSGANTYAGSTTISAGTLALGTGGSINNTPLINLTAATATVDVSAVSFTLSNGQELKGIGQVKGGVTQTAGSKLTPGDTNSVGQLTFQNNLTLSTGATNYFELGATNTPGTTCDQVVVGGTLNVGSVQWSNFNFTTNTGFGTGVYVLFEGAVSGSLGGTTIGSIGDMTGTLSLRSGNTALLLTVSGGVDTAAPMPNPMTFASAPNATGPATVVMTATAATDDSTPIQYYFSNTVNGVVSGWTNSTTWTNTGLAPSTLYGYQVKARDALLNETTNSAVQTATTLADTTAPTPAPTFASGPTPAPGGYAIAMTATVATDDYSSPVQYFFTNTVNGNVSGWQASTVWTNTGLTANTLYSYQVKARDAVSNETAFCTAASATAQVGTQYFQWNASRTTWDNGTTADWALSSGGTYDQIWTSGNDAVFESTAGTVSIAAAGATAHNLTFNITGYTIQNNTLTLNGPAPTIMLGSSRAATISSAINGSAGLTKTGPGTLTLSSANIYTGGTTNSQGTIIAGNANALGASGTITLGDANSGANAITLSQSSNGNTITRPITVANQGSGLVTIEKGNFDGAITINRSITFGSSGTSFNGGISGNGDLTIASSGGWSVGTGAVSGGGSDNTFTGDIVLAGGGILNICGGGWTSTKNLIPDSSTVNVLGTLNVSKGTGNNETIGALTGNGNVSIGNASLTVVGGTFTGSATFSGAISGAGAFAKIGGGTQTLSGSNSYSGGTTVTNGTLLLSGSGTLGATSGAVTVNGSLAVLDLGGLTRTNGAVVLGDGIITNGTLQGSSFSVTNGSVSAVFTGSAGLTKTGAGTVTLANSNTYSGDTTINGGTLRITGSLAGSTNLVINANATNQLVTAGNTSINNNAVVRINPNGKMNLAAGVGEVVRELYLDGTKQGSGRWGADPATATYVDAVHFGGSGFIYIPPDPATVVIFK